MFKTFLLLAFKAALAYLTPSKVDDLAIATGAIDAARQAILNHKDKHDAIGSKAVLKLMDLHNTMGKAQDEINKANQALDDLEAKAQNPVIIGGASDPNAIIDLGTP